MILETVVDRYFGVNTYIIADDETNKCAIIDPGAIVSDIMKIIKNKNLQPEYIILTHGHGDHIANLNALKKEIDVKVIAHEDEQELLNDKKKNLSATMYCGPQEAEADIYVKDKDKLSLGNLKLSFIHTPGHTKGCMCIRVENNLFTGDTLFAGSMGRTDFYSGDNNQMQKSLKKLTKYENELMVYPGHGPHSNLGIEKATNPYMK